jgi:Ca-activated chloride channel family protein
MKGKENSMGTQRRGSMAPAAGRKPPHTWLKILIFLLGCLALLGARPSPFPQAGEGAEGEDKTLSPYFVVVTEDPEKEALPLKSTRVEVKIAGKVAAVTVTQVYQNRGKKALEAIYVFPMSTRAAVHAMRMTIGERVIEAEIMKRAEARQTYEDAKKEGKTASLLEQERPNVFQMNVANILPGDEVQVELKYLELLRAEDTIYEFVYPTVVGPRYSKTPEAGAPEQEKWVKSPYLHEGEAPPYTFGLSVDVRGGLPISKLMSPSHEVEVKYVSPAQAQVTLKDEKSGGNRDFVLRYTLAGDKIDAGVLLYPGKDENFFLMVMEPPAQAKKEAAVPREYIFIVDVSGSMYGFPLEISKALMADIFKNLRPQDYMNVLLFESGSAVLSEQGSLPATEENKKKALSFINSRPGGGGTEILPAFKRALALPRTKGTSRIVVAATDGYVNVEAELFEVIRKNLGEANLFAFGIGTAVNRFLIEGMARAGQGEPFVILKPGEAPKQAERFKRYIDNPVLTGIKVAFEGFEAYEVEPPQLPDLFAQRPLTLLGKYRGQPQGRIVVRGKTAGGEFKREIKVEPGQASADNQALRYLWARERIQRLGDYHYFARETGGKDEARIKEITELGLKYSLMTEFTSFVAVDKIKRADGKYETVKQPLPLPQGVSDLALPQPGGPHRGMIRPKMGPAGRGGLVSSAKPLVAMEGLPAPGGKPLPKPASPGKPRGQMSLSLKDVQVYGEMGAEAVRQVLAAGLADLEQCCRQAQAKGAKIPRNIVITFGLGADGKVSQATISFGGAQEAKFKDLAACLRQVLQGLTFPTPAKGEVKVTAKLSWSGK